MTKKLTSGVKLNEKVIGVIYKKIKVDGSNRRAAVALIKAILDDNLHSTQLIVIQNKVDDIIAGKRLKRAVACLEENGYDTAVVIRKLDEEFRHPGKGSIITVVEIIIKKISFSLKQLPVM